MPQGGILCVQGHQQGLERSAQGLDQSILVQEAHFTLGGVQIHIHMVPWQLQLLQQPPVDIQKAQVVML